MEGPPPEPGRDVSRLRVSDQDRHRVAEVLRHAAGEGRLDLDELDQRLQATYEAKTYGDLVPLTADLPVTGPVLPFAAARLPGPARGSLTRYPASVGVLSETRRAGGWLVEDGHTAFALMGSVVLDLRQAEFAAGDLTINASAVMGEVRILVGVGTTVHVEGVGVMGDYCEQRAKVPFDPDRPGPVVRVRGLALMGSVHVRRLPAPGTPRRLGRSY